MTEISAEMVVAAARSLCKEDGQDPDQYRVRINGPRWHYYRGKARAALTTALAVRESPLRTADGSMTIPDLVNGVMELYPGADRQALQCLAELMTKPSTDPMPDSFWEPARL